jgi:hypothetical protein
MSSRYMILNSLIMPCNVQGFYYFGSPKEYYNLKEQNGLKTKVITEDDLHDYPAPFWTNFVKSHMGF